MVGFTGGAKHEPNVQVMGQVWLRVTWLDGEMHYVRNDRTSVELMCDCRATPSAVTFVWWSAFPDPAQGVAGHYVLGLPLGLLTVLSRNCSMWTAPGR
jgi:hypothetical protein